MECFLVDDLFGINQIYVGKFFSEKLHEAVREGDIDLVEELLDEPGADINANHYGENLLWTAIMHRQEEMAIFLIDNGIDTTFKCCRIDLQEDELPSATEKIPDKKVIQVKLNLPTTGNKNAVNSNSSRASTDSASDGIPALADVFVVTCRQLAYEKEMYNIVNLIDFKQGCLLKWLKPPSHKVRLIKSARLAKEAAAREPELPPDRASSPPRLMFRKRHPKPRHRLPNTLLTSQSAADKTPPETLALTSNLTHRPSSNCELESTSLAKDSPRNDIWQTKSVRSARTATYRQCRTPKVHLTKTAVVRQRETNMSIKQHQYHLRHPESLETTLVRPPTRQQSEPEKKIVTSNMTPGVVLSKPPLPKTNYSSYANHLPFRRKPAVFDGYIERMFKKSVHGYQHSTQNVSQRKFVGRL